MIFKGSSRAGALDLALHLSNELDNERVEVMSVRGSTSNNIYESFREWELISDCTNATKPFYSLSINPDPQQRDWTTQEWNTAIGRIENKLSLDGQPRAIIYHYKVGSSDGEMRKHCHVVWSRTNTRDHRLRTIPDSNDYYKLKAVSKELAKEFNFELRKGRVKGEAFDHAKSQGINRDPETAQQRQHTIMILWNKYGDPKQFNIALHQAGYIIAKGDRRDFVIVDPDGQVHALARQIKGVKTKKVKERLGDANDYPTVEQAKEEQHIITLTEERQAQQHTQKAKRVDLIKEQKLMAKLKRMAKRADLLRVKRRKRLNASIEKTKARHVEESAWQDRRYREQNTKLITKRKKSEPKGIAKHLRTLVGYERLLKWKYQQQDKDRERTHQKRIADTNKAWGLELERLDRHWDMIEKLERREAKSLERLSKKLALSAEKARQLAEQEQQKKLQRNNQRQLRL